MEDKMILKLGSLGNEFQLIDPISMNKITGGKSLVPSQSLHNTCGGIMPS